MKKLLILMAVWMIIISVLVLPIAVYAESHNHEWQSHHNRPGKPIKRSGAIMIANGSDIVAIKSGVKIILECGLIGINGIETMKVV